MAAATSATSAAIPRARASAYEATWSSAPRIWPKFPRRVRYGRPGLRTVVTLQSRTEISILGPPHADVLREVRWEHIPIGDRWFREREPISLVPGREHHSILHDFRADWRTFFNILAERDVYPLLFHCSAGRDRTGVGATMLLELLGVSRERIVADFLESNWCFPKMPLAAVQLEPVFELIDESGGIEAFMSEGIGLERGDLAAIREDLLEDLLEVPRRPTTLPIATAVSSAIRQASGVPRRLLIALPLRRAFLGERERAFARVLGALQSPV